MNRLVVATTNTNKVVEVRSGLSGLAGWSVDSLPEGLPGIEETGETFLANALLKAIHFSGSVDAVVLADDSGLCVAALDGRPGVLSARYADSDADRNRRLLAEMSEIPDHRRQASFVCALAVARFGKPLWTGEGRVEGLITRSLQGTQGFGYDPLFMVPEFGKTMAELSLEEKNRTSHRGLALRRLQAFLSQTGR